MYVLYVLHKIYINDAALPVWGQGKSESGVP